MKKKLLIIDFFIFYFSIKIYFYGNISYLLSLCFLLPLQEWSVLQMD